LAKGRRTEQKRSHKHSEQFCNAAHEIRASNNCRVYHGGDFAFCASPNLLYGEYLLVYDYATMRVVEKAQLMSASEIDRTLQRVAHEIVERSGGTKHLALIGIVRRGVPLAQRIAQAMRGIDGVDVPVGVLDITLYRDDLSKVAPQAVLRSSDIPFGVDDMDLVLIDDVLYTGRTIRAAMNGLFDLGRPKRVSLCVLIDRGHREMPIEAQYIGRTVQTSDTEIIEVRLNEIDKEERVVLVDRVE
jgi:pyrimidine operon attenuation protein/uracil phosphoribosyltransferase